MKPKCGVMIERRGDGEEGDNEEEETKERPFPLLKPVKPML